MHERSVVARDVSTALEYGNPTPLRLTRQWRGNHTGATQGSELKVPCTSSTTLDSCSGRWRQPGSVSGDDLSYDLLPGQLPT